MTLSHIPVFAAILLLCGIAWYDVRELKVRNKAIIALLILYLFHIVMKQFEGVGGDLFAGGLLFFIGLMMWAAKGMGAGDAKLMFPIGLFVGYMALPIFGILLFLVAIIMYLVIQFSMKGEGQGVFFNRFRQMKQDGKVPFALPLVISAVPSIILGLYGPP